LKTDTCSHPSHFKAGFSIAVSFFVVLVITISACRTKNKDVKPEEPGTEVISSDSSYLFNGRNLDGWEITNFGPQGPVYVSGNEIILGAGDGCTGITWKGSIPAENYTVTLQAKRVSGNDFFCGMTFLKGKEPCTLIIGGWGGTTVGLSSLDGMDASENETTRLMKFETGKWYDICLQVKGDSIIASIDGERVVNVNTSGKKLSIRPEVNLSQPFGIASWRTTAAIRNIRISN
jgi:hypothetical protein